jgi:hypothetical protein
MRNCQHRSYQRRVAHAIVIASAALVGTLELASPRAVADAPALLGLDGVGGHDSPSYIAKHIDLVESRPFDGIIINSYLGRNLFNSNIKKDAPTQTDSATGAITYDAAARDLSSLKGAFKRFHHNFAKVNLAMAGQPPALTDDAGWKAVEASAENFARAVHDTGLEGIFFDNEVYFRAKLPGSGKPSDYWYYEDQLLLSGRSAAQMTLAAANELSRRRGREFMLAVLRGFPNVVFMTSHSPVEGCGAWKSMTGHFSHDHYLSAAFIGGIVESTPDTAKFVDGGEDYDFRTPHDFGFARAWRKGQPADNSGSIARLDGPAKCPFMDQRLASIWQKRVSIAFSTFDKQRVAAGRDQWTPVTNMAEFESTLTNALRASDSYTWHYAQWQDWWGDTTDAQLGPWIEAIKRARAAADRGSK